MCVPCAGQNEEVGVRASLSIKSPERVDFLQGSSLELSSSNSSRGTYKWDEEGLEPLGQSTHPCECYDYSNHLNNIVSQRLVCPKVPNSYTQKHLYLPGWLDSLDIERVMRVIV